MACRLWKSRAPKPQFPETIQSDLGCPVLLAKILRFCSPSIDGFFCVVPPHKRGVSRSSRTLRRDAVDALALQDEGRAKRTAKSCGPDAPTLASSFAGSIPAQATVAKKPGHRGEREGSRKTIAQGVPDCFGVPVVTNSCVFCFHTRGCGCGLHPAFPAPSVF
jgi:hypothetical protein